MAFCASTWCPLFVEPSRIGKALSRPGTTRVRASPQCCTGQTQPLFLPRIAEVRRQTRETEVAVSLNLDGTGVCNVNTGIPFLDHMLGQISAHGIIDLDVQANEDVGISIGMALAKALGDKKGISRFGHFVAPLDEALVDVVLDFSGRPFLAYGLNIPTERVGRYDTQLVREFYAALAGNAQMTLHVTQRAGVNSHHIIEASFKAFARATRMALSYDPRRIDSIPSSKGALTDSKALDMPNVTPEAGVARVEA
jgi:imidazoleglycerol-phosphate dehydratase